MSLSKAFLKGVCTLHDLSFIDVEVHIDALNFWVGIRESFECFEQVFTPRRIFARGDSFRAQQDLKRILKVLVVGLKRIVDIKCLDPIPVNLFLVNIFNFIFVYFFVLVGFILFFFLVLFFLFGLIFCIYCFIIPSIFCVVIICSLLGVISIIFLCYALRKLDL